MNKDILIKEAARDYARSRQKSLHLSQKDTNLIQLACLHGIEIGRQSEQLTKVKVALRNVINYLGQFCSDYPDCVIKAEIILKEIENDKR